MTNYAPTKNTKDKKTELQKDLSRCFNVNVSKEMLHLRLLVDSLNSLKWLPVLGKGITKTRCNLSLEKFREKLVLKVNIATNAFTLLHFPLCCSFVVFKYFTTAPFFGLDQFYPGLFGSFPWLDSNRFG